jgi:K+-transporting ATPase c subunit
MLIKSREKGVFCFLVFKLISAVLYPIRYEIINQKMTNLAANASCSSSYETTVFSDSSVSDIVIELQCYCDTNNLL